MIQDTLKSQYSQDAKASLGRAVIRLVALGKGTRIAHWKDPAFSISLLLPLLTSLRGLIHHSNLIPPKKPFRMKSTPLRHFRQFKVQQGRERHGRLRGLSCDGCLCRDAVGG
jgi:hypothetical protein